MRSVSSCDPSEHSRPNIERQDHQLAEEAQQEHVSSDKGAEQASLLFLDLQPTPDEAAKTNGNNSGKQPRVLLIDNPINDADQIFGHQLSKEQSPKITAPPGISYKSRYDQNNKKQMKS